VQTASTLTLAAVFLASMCLAACADTPDETTDLAGVDAAVADCVEGAGTCAGNAYSVCRSGVFVNAQLCQGAETCVPGVGCRACNPGEAAVCEGEALYACTAEGARGDKIRDCASGCANGQCTAECAVGAELVYVVDVEDNLLSFDPRTNAFTPVGRLDCPAGDTWADFGEGRATPFSMAVDRQARAWILYSSGEIFWVDTATAACTRSHSRPGTPTSSSSAWPSSARGWGRPTRRCTWPAGRSARSNAAGSARSTPWRAGVTEVGALPEHEYGAELTGNGNGELWAYWPGVESVVARVDKASATVEQDWSLPPLFGQPAGWAFAHWGGRYFVFISESDGDGDVTSRVLRFDPASGDTSVAVPETGRRIVGAGVSTCAPVVSNF
jgi:hypothetical protein